MKGFREILCVAAPGFESEHPVRYGDAEDPEFLSTLPLQHARWVISTVRERDINLALLRALHHYAYRGRVAVTAYTRQEADFLKQSGADMVILPFADAAKEAADRVLASAADART